MRNPNILLIMTDQQSGNMLSVAGNRWVYTPALDGLADGGVRFEQAVCANPVCVPSRIGMATGIMPGRLGADDNASGSRATLSAHVVDHSLGRLMKRAGYATFHGGKTHLCPQLEPLQAGYDAVHENERDTLADACIGFIGQVRPQPFFAVASFINPHDICYAHNAKTGRQPQLESVTDLYRQACGLDDDTLPPLPDNFALPDHEPAGFAMRHNTRAITPPGTMSTDYTERDWRIYRWIYARLTERVDGQIGRILAALQDAGLEHETVVLFTSDHGNMQGNHRLASKMAFYEESVRVPFVMKAPGRIPAGRVEAEHLVHAGLDLIPTCCDYAGVEPPTGLFGISQRRAAEGAGNPPAHAYVVSENGNGRMLRTTRWKYTIYAGGEGREILTDLAADPGELSNLAPCAAHASDLNECRRQLHDWYVRTDDTDGLQRFTVGV